MPQTRSRRRTAWKRCWLTKWRPSTAQRCVWPNNSTDASNECQVETYTEEGEQRRERASIQATRLAGALGRMSGSFQQGMGTLQRIRFGGRQVVTVQHVQVNEGGQALVAGQMEGRPRRRTTRK